MRQLIQIDQGNSYKIGLDEVVGLKTAMLKLFKSIEKAIKQHVYWNEGSLIDEAEYKSRDGFIPHSHNCGGLQIWTVIPKCEEYNFGYLEFGEWDGEHYSDCTEPDTCDCGTDSDGEYDASLRIWFKFEGYDKETRDLNFWLYLGGGNNDAPYFRTAHETTIFEASFSCKSIKGLERAASKHVKALLKIIS
jgi:hypothetical protein